MEPSELSPLDFGPQSSNVTMLSIPYSASIPAASIGAIAGISISVALVIAYFILLSVAKQDSERGKRIQRHCGWLPGVSPRQSKKIPPAGSSGSSECVGPAKLSKPAPPAITFAQAKERAGNHARSFLAVSSLIWARMLDSCSIQDRRKMQTRYRTNLTPIMEAKTPKTTTTIGHSSMLSASRQHHHNEPSPSSTNGVISPKNGDETVAIEMPPSPSAEATVQTPDKGASPPHDTFAYSAPSEHSMQSTTGFGGVRGKACFIVVSNIFAVPAACRSTCDCRA